MASLYMNLFDQIWNDKTKLQEVTENILAHIESVYQENSPEKSILMLYNIFNDFLEDLNEDVLPNDRTGYQDSIIWKSSIIFRRTQRQASLINWKSLMVVYLQIA